MSFRLDPSIALLPTGARSRLQSRLLSVFGSDSAAPAVDAGAPEVADDSAGGGGTDASGRDRGCPSGWHGGPRLRRFGDDCGGRPAPAASTDGPIVLIAATAPKAVAMDGTNV